MSLPLGNIVQSVVGTAFELAAEIVVAHVYTQYNAVAYDPATGSVPVNGSTTTIATVDAIVGKYSQKETDGQKIRFGDERLVVQASELGNIVPVVDDFLAFLGSNVASTVATYGGGGYTLSGLTPGAVYYFVPDDNGGSEVKTTALVTLLAAEGYFTAPANGQVVLTGESADVVSATVQPISIKRQVVDIILDPTGNVYTFQTRKAQV